jgi:20S proteasome subunit alpha 7
LYQVEYAGKAVSNSGTAIGICCKDGVVLGVEKIVEYKMLESESNRRIFNVDKHVGMV